MSLKERLLDDMKAAMRDREGGRVRLATIRMARAAIQNREIELRRELNEEELLEVLARELRQRRESREEFARAGREASVAQLDEEIAVVQEYLPAPLSEAELRQAIDAVIDELGAAGPQEMGRVMSAVMPRVRGRADGSQVSRIVRELLNR